MPNVVVKPHVDTFMKSDDAQEALDSIGAIGETEFSTLSSTLVTDTEFLALSTAIVETDAAILSSMDIVPWKMRDCAAAWDYRDVVLNGGGTRVLQLTDKTGNGYHLTHPDNSSAATPTTLGIWPRGGVYTVANGGVSGIDTQAWSFVWIGRDFTTEDPNSGQTGASGWLYALSGSARPALGWGGAYTLNQGINSPQLYAAGPIFSPNGQPSIIGQSLGTTRTLYFANGSVTTRNAFGATTGNTLSCIFGKWDATQPSYRATIAIYAFRRELTTTDFTKIANYHGCPTTAGGNMVYCYGSSTPNGQGAGQTQLGVVQSFCDWIGASRSIHSIGGTSWNAYTDALATTGVLNVHRGFNNIHVFMPQSNDLGSNIPASTCITKINDGISRIKVVDQFAKFLLFPVTPRLSSFSGGQTADGFDIARLELNAGMQGIALAQENVIYCDTMSISGMRNKADSGVPPLMDIDCIHLGVSGHVEGGKSLCRGYHALNTETRDNYISQLNSPVISWVLNSDFTSLNAGGVAGSGSTVAPGQLFLDSGTTSGAYAISHMAGTSDTTGKFVKRGDNPNRANFTWRHRVWMKFFVFANSITGTGWGQFWSTDAYNSLNVGLPNKKGFGFRLIDDSGNKIQLMVHDGTTLTQGTPVAINTSLVSDIMLDMFQGVLYATLDGNVIASLAGGPTTVVSANNESTPTFYAYADTGGTNKARWVILDVRSMTTAS